MDTRTELAARFEEFHGDLFRFLAKLTADPHASEDILHDAYVQAYLKPGLFDPGRGSMKNWVFRIAINIYYDRERFRAKEARAVSEYYAELARERAGGTGEEGEVNDFVYTREMLDQAVQMLDPERRAIFLLSLKYPLKDIADILAIAEGTVKSRLHYIRRELRSNLRELHEGEIK